jgi:hypothetical protein
VIQLDPASNFGKNAYLQLGGITLVAPAVDSLLKG